MKNYYFIPLLFLCAMSQAQPVNIPDANFKNALVNTPCVDFDGDGAPDGDADTNNDGEIQVSEAEAVLGMGIYDRNISSLEGIQSFINLELLYCQTNQLTILDISQNLNLKILYCGENQLTSLDITQNTNLEDLYCWDNQLTSIDITQNLNLKELVCGNNQLRELDVTQHTNLEYLYCGDNQLTSLHINNGNNHNMPGFGALGNPNLTCIQVDDETATRPICDPILIGWCKDPWAEYKEDCSLGLEEYNQLSFTIFPNPTQDVLNIDSQEPIESVRIYSINGSIIKETFNTSIIVSEFPKGLYFAQINIGTHSITKKFIKS